MRAAARVAVIGLGFMGSRWAATVAEHDGAELTLVCDLDTQRAEEAARRYDCRWTADAVGAASAPDVDAVVVCTPDHLHEQPAVAAIDAGRVLALEKPFAHELAAAERIRRAAEAADVPVLAAHVLRFDPRYAAIRQAIDAGHIGAVQAVRSERIGVVSDQVVLQGRVSVPLYYGTHEMDLAQWYAGPLSTVSAVRSQGVLRNHGYRIDDLYSATLNFANGAHGTSMIGWLLPAGSPPLAGFTVIGEEGFLRVEQGATGLQMHGSHGPVAVDTWYAPHMHGRGVGALANEVAHFVRVVHGEQEPLCTAADGVAAVRAAVALERAAAEDRSVTV